MQTTAYGASKYNLPTYVPDAPGISAASNGAVTGVAVNVGQLSPSNPALWLLGLGFVTLGLIAFSTHVRVGHVQASVST